MTDDIRVPSPCVRNCCLNDDDVCLGCFRSLAEIRAWSQADDRARRQILQNVERRRLLRGCRLPNDA